VVSSTTTNAGATSPKRSTDEEEVELIWTNIAGKSTDQLSLIQRMFVAICKQHLHYCGDRPNKFEISRQEQYSRIDRIAICLGVTPTSEFKQSDLQKWLSTSDYVQM
jgi:hypothetical protein